MGRESRTSWNVGAAMINDIFFLMSFFILKNSKDVSLPSQLQRAMATEAEAARWEIFFLHFFFCANSLLHTFSSFFFISSPVVAVCCCCFKLKTKQRSTCKSYRSGGWNESIESIKGSSRYIIGESRSPSTSLFANVEQHFKRKEFHNHFPTANGFDNAFHEHGEKHANATTQCMMMNFVCKKLFFFIKIFFFLFFYNKKKPK